MTTDPNIQDQTQATDASEPPEPSWRPKVLVLDDEWSTLERIKGSLSDQFDVLVASRAEEALSLAENQQLDVVITDVRMPDMDGLSLVSELKSRFPDTQYILMTAFSDIEDTISAIRLGVADYLRKPFTISEVRHALNRCLWQQRLRREVASLRSGDHQFLSAIIARDERMREVCRLAETVAATDATVLVSGETGTGKGLLARAMHNSSPRADRPYVEINCAAIPETLIESELFGHEKGSFTGAVARKLGRVEAAAGGTLLLDEVGEMPLDMQAKLLRFLQSFHFERVGGNKRLKEATGARLVIHEGDAPMLGHLNQAAASFGLSAENSPAPDEMPGDGDTLQFGKITLKVLHVPGHSPGGIALSTDDAVFVGDTLFSGSIGRTDLPGGDYNQLIASVRLKLFNLPDNTQVHCGHGPSTTIGREKRYNPFFR